MFEKVLRIAGRYLIASGACGLLGLLLLYPHHPTTVLGVVLWFLGVLPLLAAIDGLGQVFINRRVSRAISTREDRLSAGRIAYGVFAMLLIMAIVTIGFILAGSVMEIAGEDFWDTHFSDSW